MAILSRPKNWATNSAHCYLTEEKSKWVFIIYDTFKAPYGEPIGSGKRDDLETAIEAARTAAKKHGLTIGTWSNLTSTI